MIRKTDDHNVVINLSDKGSQATAHRIGDSLQRKYLEAAEIENQSRSASTRRFIS